MRKIFQGLGRRHSEDTYSLLKGRINTHNSIKTLLIFQAFDKPVASAAQEACYSSNTLHRELACKSPDHLAHNNICIQWNTLGTRSDKT